MLHPRLEMRDSVDNGLTWQNLFAHRQLIEHALETEKRRSDKVNEKQTEKDYDWVVEGALGKAMLSSRYVDTSIEKNIRLTLDVPLFVRRFLYGQSFVFIYSIL